MMSQTAEYALRAVVVLASEDGVVNRDDIARLSQVPKDYLIKVLHALVDTDLVMAKRGPGGGFRLARSADDISLWDVICSVDAPLRITECPLGLVDHTRLCPLHAKLDQVAESAEAAYRSTSLSELLASARRGRQCPFPLGLDKRPPSDGRA